MKGAVTAIKNQGQCGSCWAFSTTGAIEGAVAIASGELPSLSEQELVDCSVSLGNEGCDGGLPVNAAKWIVDNGGIASEAHYHTYDAAQWRCDWNETGRNKDAEINAFTQVPQDDTAIMAAVAQQPVSVAIDATVLQSYSSGIISEQCSGTLDHAVLIVGYNSSIDATTGKMTPYWIVKNSWGTTWGGNDGYFYVARGKSNSICIMNQALVVAAGVAPPAPPPPPPEAMKKCSKYMSKLGDTAQTGRQECGGGNYCCCAKDGLFGFSCKERTCCEENLTCLDVKTRSLNGGLSNTRQCLPRPNTP